MKGRPIMLSLTLLVLSVGGLAWAASFALVLALPRPTDLGRSIADVAAILSGAATARERGFRSSIRAEPTIPPNKAPLQKEIARSLAAVLKEPAEIRVKFRSFAMKGLGNRMPSPTVALADRSLSVTGSAFAVRRPDGSWLVLRQDEPFLSRWHLQILGAFFAFALLLVPIALLVARRLSAPMRALAQWVERAEMARAGPGPPLGGPRELRQVAAAIDRMQARLRQQMEERTTMLAAVAHDLRTPLTAIRVRSEAAPPEARDAMVADIRRMEQMIAQFLSFVAGSANAPSAAEVDLRELAQAAVRHARDAGLPVAADFDGPARVRGSALDLRRMIDNLIDNAVRFAGSAELRLEADVEHLVLRVLDEGTGLEEEELERVFEPFYRPDAARNSETGGTGLGLAIVRAIARAHGGEVTLRNRTGRSGLEAEVRIPKA